MKKEREKRNYNYIIWLSQFSSPPSQAPNHSRKGLQPTQDKEKKQLKFLYTTQRKFVQHDQLICLSGFPGQQMYDTDRSGCITKEEVASMLRALPEDCLPADITEPGKLDEIFDRMDANSDGKVTFDEFKAAMQRDSSLQDMVLSSLRPQ